MGMYHSQGEMNEISRIFDHLIQSEKDILMQDFKNSDRQDFTALSKSPCWANPLTPIF